MKDKKGNKIPDVERQKRRWAEQFEELLNRPAPLNPVDFQPAERDLQIACDIPSKGRRARQHFGRSAES